MLEAIQSGQRTMFIKREKKSKKPRLKTLEVLWVLFWGDFGVIQGKRCPWRSRTSLRSCSEIRLLRFRCNLPFLPGTSWAVGRFPLLHISFGHKCKPRSVAACSPLHSETPDTPQARSPSTASRSERGN